MKGEQQSKNANMLRAELRRQGITARRWSSRSPSRCSAAPARRSRAKDIAVFSRQIATMIKSGVPIVQALEIIGGGQKNPR